MAISLNHYPLDPCRADLGERLHAALKALVPDSGNLELTPTAIGHLLEQPPERELGDYALPCFRFAKDTKRKPQEIAATIATMLPPGGWLARTVAVGAFLNIFIDHQTLAAKVLPEVASGEAFKQLKNLPAHRHEKVMIEFSQPNTHKEFHVGHGRNVCLGNSLVHLYRYCGYEVVSANYFGDDGTHIATVLSYLDRLKPIPPKSHKGEWLGQMYVAAKRELEDADAETKTKLLADISRIHRQIETKAGDIYQTWQKTRQWSLDDFAAIYDWLSVHFDVLFYESEVSEDAQTIVDQYLTKGVFKVDQGAVGVDLKPYKLGFCILRKSDGNTLYATKDLALAKRKFEDFSITRSIYVVADEQNHHFRQVFKVLELMGFPEAKQCFHLSYGMVVLPEGKMSSRDGTAVSFNSLRQMMLDHLNAILAKYSGEWTADEIAATAHQLCDGAIKYGMVSTDPVKEIVFNLEDWLSFEGNSGPYLMYSFTRTRSILRKAEEQGLAPSLLYVTELKAASEHELLRFILDFNRVVAIACENCKPSILAMHLFYMCKAFNRFYVDVPVLKAETRELASARLAVTSAFGETLKQGLLLLGITPPQRM